MSIILDVDFDGGYHAIMTAGGGQPTQVPKHTFSIALDSTGEWRMVRPLSPYWRYLVPQEPRGRWRKDISGAFILMDVGNSVEIFRLMSSEACAGAFWCWQRAGNRGATMFDGSGSWKPTDQPLPKSWIGVMVKGSANVVVGADGGFAGVMQLWGDNTHGCTFFSKSGRLGAVAGFSGGLALVYATGFDRADQFNGFSSSQADFALAVGAKVSAFVNPNFARLLGSLGKFEGGVETVESLVKGVNPKYGKVRTELPGIAKALSQKCLIDSDAQSITVIDIPLAGGGAELGIYYGWSSTNLLSQW
jgi:hypothetical protein